MVERLLAAGANPNAAQVERADAADDGRAHGQPRRSCEALLARGADIDAATAATHETALMWAVAGRHRDVVRALVARGADVHPQPRQAFSPLIAAARNGDVETARVLLAAGSARR